MRHSARRSVSEREVPAVSDPASTPVHLASALDGLAENPELPAELVRRLLGYRRGLGHAAMRADLTPEMIAEIITANHHWLMHSLALNRHLPDAVRLQLAGHRDSSVRAALVVSGRDAGRDVFVRLIDDPDKQVRQYLAEGDHVPAGLRARLAADRDPEIRATLARWWPQAPEEVRRTLLTDPEDKVRAAACSTYYARLPHPIPPADLVPGLLADPVTRVGAVRHCTLTAEIALWLSDDPNHQVRRQLAEHPQLPSDLRDKLAEDPSACVRVGIFARPDTPEPTRSEIYTEIQQQGSRSLIDAPDDELDDNAALQQVEDYFALVELRDLRLDWVTADPLPHVGSPYACFRLSAACNPSLPPEAVMRLLDDNESNVRTTMARHAPHLVDEDAAERIDRTFRPRKRTRWRPADDFTFSSQTLRRFATDPDPRMRRLAPRDPDLPADLAERLADDPDSSVRRAVAPHPRLPTPALTALLADQDEWVAKAAASSPSLPTAEMDRLLRLAGL